MPPEIVILADDLIWATRLEGAAERAGLRPIRLKRPTDLAGVLERRPAPALAVVDLGGRSYDGVAAVAEARSAGLRVLAVGQHEDVALRRRALDAGAERVLAYNKLFRDGPAVLGRFVAAAAAPKAAPKPAP